MAVMGVWGFILCTRRRWHTKQKKKKAWKHRFSLNRKRRSRLFYTIVLSGIWNPLISGQIVNSFGQGKCTFDCQSGNLKARACWELKYWSPSTLLVCGHFMQIHSCMSSHACTQITINTFINDLVFFTVIIQC